jgi:hypothetical protein
MKTSMAKLDLPEDDRKRGIRWFSPTGCVEQREDAFYVFVGGTLVGSFDGSDATMRNVLAVTLSRDPLVHLGRMARAFHMSSERLRQLRRKMEEGGLAALTVPAKNGRPAKVTPKVRAKLEAMFESGLTIVQVHKKMRRLGKSTVGAVHTAWNAKKKAQQAQTSPDATQVTLPGIKRIAPPPPREPEAVVEEPVRGGAFVQHAGSWLMLGMLREQGLYAAATRACEERVEPEALRVAFDAIAVALTLGQSCVEGVRRVATPSAPLLLRARTCPSPRTVRAIMRELSDEFGAVKLHVGMLARYLADADRRASGVYYVDNHLRPYTGKRVVRRGWRMQDKRVRPGNTDYYVHDERGRPLFRIDVPSHDSLTQWLPPIARLLRRATGPQERVLLAFDRAGAFPEAMALLRDERFEAVTYERRPFPLLPESAFTQTFHVGQDDVVRFTESRINLGAGRGRLRRVAVREADGRQVNLLAVSELPAERLIRVMRGRWRQENGFKHGVERWGINQLDRRSTEPYTPDTIVPNPARRRLDRDLRAAAIREGDARRMLAMLGDSDRRRGRVEGDLAEAMKAQRDLEALRAITPKRAPLNDTELAGKLVRHDGRVKMAIDSVRIACANVESELASMLAPHLRKPREAKKTLANLFAAPGRIRVGLRTIAVHLAPAAKPKERIAFAQLLKEVNHRNLALPGDPERRSLRFRSQIE